MKHFLFLFTLIVFSKQLYGQYFTGQSDLPPFMSEPKERVAQYTKDISMDNQNAEAYFLRGVAYLESMNPWSAIGDFNKTLAIDSMFADAYHYRAQCKQLLGDKQAALEDWNKAIMLNPKNPYYRNNRAIQLIELGDTVACKADLDSAIAYKPDYLEPLQNKIVIFFDGKDDEKELFNTILRVIELDSTNTFAYYNLGIYRATKMNDLKGAVSAFSKGIKFDPNNPELYFKRGLAKSEQKQYKGAIQDYTKGIELTEEDTLKAYYLLDRGLVKIELNSYTEAEKDFAKAKELNPGLSTAWYDHGLVLIQLNRKTEGCKDLRKAKELGHPKTQEAINRHCK